MSLLLAMVLGKQISQVALKLIFLSYFMCMFASCGKETVTICYEEEETLYTVLDTTIATLDYSPEQRDLAIEVSVEGLVDETSKPFKEVYPDHVSDLEMLRILVYTEAPKKITFEAHLIIECILYRLWQSGHNNLYDYINKNKMHFQGWSNKSHYYTGKKRGYPRHKAVKEVVDYRVSLSKEYYRSIRYYHNPSIKETILYGKKKKLNTKHIAYVLDEVEKGNLEVVSLPSAHDFFEVPVELFNQEDYIKWRDSWKKKNGISTI